MDNEFDLFLAQISEQMQQGWGYHVALRKIGRHVLYEKKMSLEKQQVLRDMIDYYCQLKTITPRDQNMQGYFTSLAVITKDELRELRKAHPRYQ